jgi:alginate O-acetyltransferase complex protein AlgF
MLLALSLLARGACAGDEPVYGPTIEADSAFLRVFNASPRPIEDARIGDRVLGDIAPYAASEYAVLPAGRYPVVVGGAPRTLSLKRDHYHTAVVLPDNSVRVVDVGRDENRLKAQVIFYNLTDAPSLALKTAAGDVAVVDAVAPNAAGTREVNAVRANLAVFDGGKAVARPAPVNLQRGRAFSLFAAGTREQPVTVWVAAP